MTSNYEDCVQRAALWAIESDCPDHLISPTVTNQAALWAHLESGQGGCAWA
jgi:hypothetical protein